MQRVTDISGCDVVVNHDLPPGLPRILGEGDRAQ